MKVGNLDERHAGPLEDDIVFDWVEGPATPDGTPGPPVPRFSTNRLAIGACLMYSGPNKAIPHGPELDQTDKQTIFAMNQIVVPANRAKQDHFDLKSEDIAYLRKVGPHVLNPIVWGYLDQELKVAESITTPVAELPKPHEKSDAPTASEEPPAGIPMA